MLLGVSKVGNRSQLLSGSSPKMSPVAPYQPFPIPGVNAPAPRTEHVTKPVESSYTTPLFSPAPLTPLAPARNSAPISEAIPEIVVTGKRIPWYAWVAAGVAGFAVLDSLLGRK